MAEGKKTDLRVIRTRMMLKAAFKRLVVRLPKDQITVTALADETPINRRTFYLHYTSVDEMLMDIESDYADETIEQLDEIQGKLADGILVFYRYMNTDDQAMQKLLFGDGYYPFFKKYTDDVLSCDFFQKYYRMTKFEDLTRGYFDASVEIFLKWRNDENKQMTLETLATETAKLLMNGLSH